MSTNDDRYNLAAEPVPPDAGEMADPVIPGEYRGFNAVAYRNGFHAGHKHALTSAALAPQPVPVPEGPSDAELIQLAFREKLGRLDSNGNIITRYYYPMDIGENVIDFARAVLVRWGRLAPQPVMEGPTNQEIEEWAAASSVPGEFLDPDSDRWERCFTSVKFCATIRAALEEWGTPNLAQTRSSLGDGPAVPSGREPASVSEETTDEDIMALMPQPVPEEPSDEDLWAVGDEDFRANCWPTDAIRFARAVLDRWGRP